jgi:hypothetical protein
MDHVEGPGVTGHHPQPAQGAGKKPGRFIDMESTKMPSRSIIFCLLTACAAIELLLFGWLCSLNQEAFGEFVWTPDTVEYNRIALQLFEYNRIALPLAENATLTSGQRTPGYPAFLYMGYLIGGRSYGIYVVIATQLIFNIIFTWGCWRLLQRIAPAAGIGLKCIVTLFFFWAGLGMALALTTDFLSSLFFGVFLYGVMFCRSRSSVLLSGTSLSLATLTRPTFTLIPFLLPLAAYFIGQFSSKVPRKHLIAFMIFSVMATCISSIYQYTADGYIGPSPIVTQNIERAIYFSLKESYLTEANYIGEFKQDIGRRAGQPYGTLSRSDQEKYAKEMFFEVLISHPGQILLYLVKNFVKYIFVPIEACVMKLTMFYISEQTYVAYVRPVLGLLCLPIWLLSLSPPIGFPKKSKKYYLCVVTLLLYVVGLSAMTPLQGERMRFPMLAFMLPVMVWNIHGLHSYLMSVFKKLS